MILKFICKHKRHRKAQRIISNRNTARGISFPEFWLYYKTIAIKIAYFLHKNRDINQLNSTENPNVSPCFYSHLSFDKEAKKHTEEQTAFSTNGAGQSGQLHAEEWSWTLIPHPAQNCKWIRNLSKRSAILISFKPLFHH